MSVFFFNDTATTEIYTLSLHDALPISRLREVNFDGSWHLRNVDALAFCTRLMLASLEGTDVEDLWKLRQRNPRLRILADRLVSDRKSTRLNSSHANISYAVFCLKKKKY